MPGCALELWCPYGAMGWPPSSRGPGRRGDTGASELALIGNGYTVGDGTLCVSMHACMHAHACAGAASSACTHACACTALRSLLPDNAHGQGEALVHLRACTHAHLRRLPRTYVYAPMLLLLLPLLLPSCILCTSLILAHGPPLSPNPRVEYEEDGKRYWVTRGRLRPVARVSLHTPCVCARYLHTCGVCCPPGLPTSPNHGMDHAGRQAGRRVLPDRRIQRRSCAQ